MWLNSNSIDNEEIALLKEEEEETLSLGDMPNNNEENQTTKKFPLGTESVTTQDQEFDFFQGQILPLSDCHDIGITGGATCKKTSLTDYSSLQIRIGSMEHCHHPIGIKNSSINSSTTNSRCSSYEPQIRNQFHSQPSPTPQIRFSKITNINSCNRKSTMWSLFRVGLVITPEIALQDLKIRRNKNSNISQNNNSNSSSNDNRMRSIQTKRAFLGSCKCSVETVPSKLVTINRGSTNRKRVEQPGAQSILCIPIVNIRSSNI